MDKHVNEHQELPCEICGQVFLHVGVLKRHMNTFSHTGIKSFGKFARNLNLFDMFFFVY